MPWSAAGPRSGAVAISRHALARTIRWPARLPLSTVEMYAGSSGARVRVSYQLRKCPRKRSRRRALASVRSTRSTASSRPIQPRSFAVTAASRLSPMLVGDVRCATARTGSSWRLSGGK